MSRVDEARKLLARMVGVAGVECVCDDDQPCDWHTYAEAEAAILALVAGLEEARDALQAELERLRHGI